MDFDRSSGGRPWRIVIDHTRPIVEVDISGGSAPLTAGTVSNGGPFKRPRTDQPPEIPAAAVNGFGGSPPPASSVRPPPIPNATNSVIDIPISNSKAVRVGCWASSPIDSDALKGQIFPNFLQTLKEKDSLRSYGSPDLKTLETIRNDFLRSPSEFPEINLLLQTLKEEDSQSPSGFPEIKFSVPGGQSSDEIRMTSDGPLPRSIVLKCSDAPKEEVDAILKVIEREKKLGRWNWKDIELRENLKRREITFKSQYSYSTMEYRHCITANHASCWKQESSGIMWAGVYGIDNICVVTLTGQHLDWKRVHGCLASLSPELVLTLFRECVLSELEDLADPTCGRSFDPPFYVVSETLMPDESGHETSSSVAHAHEAAAFVQGSGLLQQAMDRGCTIKLAISAFQSLMGKKFEAKEIGVTVLFGRKSGTGDIRDLDISEIGDYLAAVEPIMGV